MLTSTMQWNVQYLKFKLVGEIVNEIHLKTYQNYIWK